jgi:tetrahydromethanopterin S-methyltransferase subunit B
MAYIQVLPEFGLVADPMIGIVTSAGESLAPVLEKVALLDAVSDDLVNMLSGEGNLLASFPNRENGLAIGGIITSFWYGLAIGLFIAGIIAFQLIQVG